MTGVLRGPCRAAGGVYHRRQNANRAVARARIRPVPSGRAS